MDYESKAGRPAPEASAGQPAAISVPEPSLVILVGPTGCGKTTWASEHFAPTEVVSSDACRLLVADTTDGGFSTPSAFRVVHAIVEERLRLGFLTVVDATNLRRGDRASLVRLGRAAYLPVGAVVFDTPFGVCCSRRPSLKHVVRHHFRMTQVERVTGRKEGLAWVETVTHHTPRVVVRQPLHPDKRQDSGPFDIIGDVHGCADELAELLGKLDYVLQASGAWVHPEGRRLIFLGDLGDRGPKVVPVFSWVLDSIEAGTAVWLRGNHDDKLMRKLRGNPVKVSHGLGDTLEQLAALPEDQREALTSRLLAAYGELPHHLVLDRGNLVVAHAGLPAPYQGRVGYEVRQFALYGSVEGKVRDDGMPIRDIWAPDYRGRAHVVYGHTAVRKPIWVSRTIGIDTGCAFGGALTALRWPEQELVSAPAHGTYAEVGGWWADDPDEAAAGAPLSAGPLLKSRTVHTSYLPVSVKADRCAAAFEELVRWGVDPRWLVYLPPTMAPGEAAPEGQPLLERPEEAFAYYRNHGVAQVVCEEKHMGSRAVVVVCQTPEVASRRFGVEGMGAIYSRTGRPFFRKPEEEAALLARFSEALAGAWGSYLHDWAVFDVEIMPWSLKARGLLQAQYAGAASAAIRGFSQAAYDARLADWRGTEGITELSERLALSETAAHAMRAAYRHYCWETEGLNQVRVAPFHLLATEGTVFADKDHGWHWQMTSAMAGCGAPFQATDGRLVALGDEVACAETTEWWRKMTAAGGEGMVVKPFDFAAKHDDRWIQPALKVRGREYLRIIYGLDYCEPWNLDRLRRRQTGRKRALAIQEFALGIEALRRFVEREPLQRVQDCILAVRALECDPLDPRL